MYLCIHGFLHDSAEDDSLKFKLHLDGAFNENIIQFLGHRSLNAMAEGEWLLSGEQIAHISAVIGQPLPTDLEMYIGVQSGPSSHRQPNPLR